MSTKKTVSMILFLVSQFIPINSTLGQTIEQNWRETTKKELKRHRHIHPTFLHQEYAQFHSRSLQGSTNVYVDYGPNHPFDAATNKNTTEYSNIRIFPDTSQLEMTYIMASYENKIKIDVIRQEILPSMSRIWSSYLKVVPVKGIIPIPSTDICGRDVVQPPYKYLIEGVPGADLVAFVQVNLDCSGSGTLAYAIPCILDQYDRPIIGRVVFCLDSIPVVDDDVPPDSKNITIDTSVHEMGHLLGINSQLMPYYRDKNGVPLTPRPFGLTNVTCVDGKTREVLAPSSATLEAGILSNGVRYFEVITPLVQTIVRNQFRCPELKGARLETQPTMMDDCFGSHFDERLFFTELMSAVYNPGITMLSPLSLALLEDSGWYKADYTSVPISSFGYTAGCDFVNDPCIIGGEIPSYSKSYFCNTPLNSLPNEQTVTDGTPTCDPTHTQLSLCDLADHSNAKARNLPPPNSEFQYFSNPNIFPFLTTEAQYCPIPHIMVHDCRFPLPASPSADTSPTATRTKRSFEAFGPHSRCYNFQRNVQSGAIQPEAYCLETRCNTDTMKVEAFVYGIKLVCDHDFQIRLIHDSVTGEIMALECPKFSSICPDLICPANCAGRGICNYSSSKKPYCQCFNTSDTTSACVNTPWIGPTLAQPPPSTVAQPKETSSAYSLLFYSYHAVFMSFSILFGFCIS